MMDRFQKLADNLVDQAFKDNREELNFAFEKLILGREFALKVSWDDRTEKVKMKLVDLDHSGLDDKS